MKNKNSGKAFFTTILLIVLIAIFVLPVVLNKLDNKRAEKDNKEMIKITEALRRAICTSFHNSS